MGSSEKILHNLRDYIIPQIFIYTYSNHSAFILHDFTHIKIHKYCSSTYKLKSRINH